MIELRERLEDGHERHRAAHDSSSADHDDPARPVRRHRRAVGQRQVDAARPDRRPRRADHPGRSSSTASTSRSSAKTRWRKLRGEKIGFVFQFFHLIPSLTALENVAVPMEIAGAADAGAAGRGAARGSRADGPRRTTIRRSCRAASSSASRSRARWPTTRRLCWPTSRPAISTAPTAATSWICCATIHRSRGTTLVLVTHDAELAAHGRCAHRRCATADVVRRVVA